MSAAKVVKLTARPSVCAYLSFEVGGIIESMNVTLGQTIASFDLVNYYTNLGTTIEEKFIGFGGATGVGGVRGPIIEQEPENLLNSGDISADIGAAQLMCLRAEGIRAALDKICALRANVYLSTFSNKEAIFTLMTQFYSNTGAGTKYANLQALSTLANNQYNELNAAYQQANITNVVPSTSSQLTEMDNKKNITGYQNMTYTDYGYRVPSIEAQAQNLRAQISLMDEQFNQFMAGQTVAHMKEVFGNQLTAIDMDVKQLQVAYLNTILVCPQPIAGTVTGLYCQVGDAVLAGQPVLRVENNSTVWLTGVIICRTMLTVGASVTVQTNAFSAAGAVTLQGTILTARGHESGDDRWEVVISCTNTANVPSNYHFDFDDTTITIS